MGNRPRAGSLQSLNSHGVLDMKKMIIASAAALALLAGMNGAAEAKGCIKGAVVGGVAGHMAGHGVMGAAAGCAVGHHMAAKKRAEQQAQYR